MTVRPECPLKGSQFYLYERFEDGGKISKTDGEGKLAEKNLSFRPWSGFQVFSEGTTNEKGEITYKDTRKYAYEKTYCDGHAAPSWANMPEDQEDGDSGDKDGKKSDAYEEAAEQTRDNNRAAAKQWMELMEACEAEAEGGCHFHWLADESVYDEVQEVLESGEPDGRSQKSAGNERKLRAASEDALEESGCKADCEETYRRFIGLRFTYTWKEIQARNGYILHDLHLDDIPVEMITTDSSQAGVNAEKRSGSSREITENIWYSGNGVTGGSTVSERKIPVVKSHAGTIMKRTASNAEADTKEAAVKATASNAEKKSIFDRFYDWFMGRSRDEADDGEESDGWGEFEGVGDFEDILADAEEDGPASGSQGFRKVFALYGAETAGMPGMCMTIELRGGSISRKKTEISFGEKRMIIRPTGIRKETEHLKGPFMAFLRRKTSFILMRR